VHLVDVFLLRSIATELASFAVALVFRIEEVQRQRFPFLAFDTTRLLVSAPAPVCALGDPAPTPAPTSTPTATSTAIPTLRATPTMTSQPSVTVTVSPTASVTPTPPTASPVATTTPGPPRRQPAMKRPWRQ
jgi:hypothetical protein